MINNHLRISTLQKSAQNRKSVHSIGLYYIREKAHSRLGYLRPEDYIKNPKFSVVAQTGHPVSPLRLLIISFLAVTFEAQYGIVQFLSLYFLPRQVEVFDRPNRIFI